MRQAVQDVFRKHGGLQVGAEIVKHKGQHWVLGHAHHDLQVVLVGEVGCAHGQGGGPMERNVLREADEHRLLVEHILAAEDDPPSEHRSGKAVDGPRGVVAGRGTLVHDAQFAFSTIVQADAPIEEVAQHQASGGAFHSGTDVGNAPFRALFHCIRMWRRAQQRSISAAPIPLLRVTEEVARRLKLRMAQTELHNAFRVLVRPNMVACSPHHRRQVVPRDRQELLFHRGSHGQEIVADEIADALLDKRVLRQGRVLKRVEAILWRQPRQDKWREFVLVQRFDGQLLAQLEHLEAVVRPEGLVRQAAEVHETDQRRCGFVVPVELDVHMGSLVRAELLAEPLRLRRKNNFVRMDLAALDADGHIRKVSALEKCEEVELQGLVRHVSNESLMR
mmetsp:Transcript_125480/g.360682  ORF Transcript_125480/g.360682 Transcript_125480/m.360682 type:complete len:391 (-) Transcript_125480:50-1222(-)